MSRIDLFIGTCPAWNSFELMICISACTISIVRIPMLTSLLSTATTQHYSTLCPVMLGQQQASQVRKVIISLEVSGTM
jgi:hypothetical protein